MTGVQRRNERMHAMFERAKMLQAEQRKSIQGISDLPGQIDLPECEANRTGLARKRAAEPLRPNKPQKPMDIGLFSDEASQLDLVEMLQEPTNEEE